MEEDRITVLDALKISTVIIIGFFSFSAFFFLLTAFFYGGDVWVATHRVFWASIEPLFFWNS
ncbi:hypothetical protein FIV00_25935 [Labrenzia sp. THAF82]|uniref:hypothetical protein n=1 Tax=Labrenzia sp. THAF82 TaxID=2587861 RepID=UPI0012680DA3|nr:hypothetical protein [Labrenzia sp. THAF82]QFT33963.1 hypothetical protein FIV00_25935 [Labrenzia sp. THAF82]